MNQQKSFDISVSVAQGLISLGFLIIVFVAFMCYRYYEVFTVFKEILPIGTSTVDPDRFIAARLIGICIVTATMLFMVHAEKFSPIRIPKGDKKDQFRTWYWSKLVLFLISFIINALFWQVWTYKDQPELYTKWFMSAMIASMDYGFAHLFDVLRKQRTISEDINKLEERLNKLKEGVKEELTKFKKLQTNQEVIQSEMMKSFCERCQVQYGSIHAKNRHKCKK